MPSCASIGVPQLDEQLMGKNPRLKAAVDCEIFAMLGRELAFILWLFHLAIGKG